MLAHWNLKQNMCLCSKQSSLFSFYALPSGGKSKDVVVHCQVQQVVLTLVPFWLGVISGPTMPRKSLFFAAFGLRTSTTTKTAFALSTTKRCNWHRQNPLELSSRGASTRKKCSTRSEKFLTSEPIRSKSLTR